MSDLGDALNGIRRLAVGDAVDIIASALDKAADDIESRGAPEDRVTPYRLKAMWIRKEFLAYAKKRQRETRSASGHLMQNPRNGKWKKIIY